MQVDIATLLDVNKHGICIAKHSQAEPTFLLTDATTTKIQCDTATTYATKIERLVAPVPKPTQ